MGRFTLRLWWWAGLVVLAAASSAAAAPPPGVSVDPAQVPPPEVAVIAQHGDHLTWVDKLPDASGKKIEIVLDRTGKRTRALPIDPMENLDLGPAPRGRGSIAVYSRCPTSCDVWRYDFRAERETRVAIASGPGSQTLPSVWGDRIAFAQGASLFVGPLRGRGRARRLDKASGGDVWDVELGAKHIGYVMEDIFEGDDYSAAVVWLRGLDSNRVMELAQRGLTDSCDGGAGALQFDARVLTWKMYRSCLCKSGTTEIVRYDIRGGNRVRPVARSRAPLAVRYGAIQVGSGPDC
jgi:hypothetical protein